MMYILSITIFSADVLFPLPMYIWFLPDYEKSPYFEINFILQAIASTFCLMFSSSMTCLFCFLTRIILCHLDFINESCLQVGLCEELVSNRTKNKDQILNVCETKELIQFIVDLHNDLIV